MRQNLINFFVLALSFLITTNASAETNLSYPQSGMLALQDSKNPKLIHISCKPHGENQIKCRQLKVFIRENKVIPYSKILEQLKETWEVGDTRALVLDTCSNTLEQFPLLDKEDIRNRLTRARQEKGLERNKIQQEFAVDFSLGMREVCDGPLNIESAADFFFHLQKQSSAICYIDWMPDFEKIYLLDQANEQWTYRMDTDGLCGRQIITENIRSSKIQYYENLFELEVLNTYPDMVDETQCQGGLEPKPLKQLYSPTRTKHSRACMGFVFE